MKKTNNSLRKIWKILLFAMFPIAIFVGCQKELSVENGAPATGTLKNSISGDCLSSTVSGVYIGDTTLKASNFIEVEVDVTSVGIYSIKSDTLNGYFFSDAGTFGATGVQKITLKGTGKPATGGTNSFTITFGSSSCTVNVLVLPSGTVPAIFSLGNTPGACSGATVAGTYTAGTALTSSNSITFDVLVTTAGTYTINSNSVNGISFSQSGFFATPGPQTVTLTGTGTPVAAGANNYTVTAGTGSCTFSIDALATPGAAVFTLGGAPGSCTGFILAGTYTAGTPLTAANTVTLQVNVTTAGTYTISTNTVNGISFSKAGTFAAAGTAQIVILTGTGTPVAAGTFNFAATAGTGNCTFSVTVSPGTATVNNDYFPLTANSFWTYDTDDFTVQDTIYNLSSTFATLAGNVYRYFEVGTGTVGVSPDDSTAYRKAGNDYFNYNFTDAYATFFFDAPVLADINFLKENAPTNTTWETPEFTGTTTPFGTTTSVAAKVKYSFVITSANTSLIVNGVTFNNVIHVSWKSRENINNAGYTDAIAYEGYYAKGVGLIKLAFTYTAFPIPITNQIRHYKIF